MSRHARDRRDADTAPQGTGKTPGFEIERIDFDNAIGAPVRIPAISIKSGTCRLQAAPIEVKLAGSSIDAGVISGYGSVFGVVDDYGDVIERGAFAANLREHKAAGTAPIMLWAHDPARPIGVWDVVEEDAHGLKMSGRLNLETSDGRDARALLKQGAVSGLSIGFRVTPGGASMDKTGIRRLKSVELWEVSLVAFPANSASRVTGVKAMESRRDFETFLQNSGFPKAAARKISAGGWPALANRDPAAADLAASIRSAISELKGAK